MLSMPLNSYADNAAYSLVYVLLLVIVIMEYYLFACDKSAVAAWMIAILSSLPLFGCILYCYWELYLRYLQYKRSNNEEFEDLSPTDINEDTKL